ncbi:hypothetical protein A3G53_01170 [Candidatus Nomurabacteria bacterium RIFCSPLOWO2_12_FULL_44_11]|uniref:UDP-N-acetylmuramoyl-L-alanyl-D-glutamate--2,6-diaminopimelate ligase n=1 Tax=Candidatus Nomurabacteria bacterium RIFCSPLOWO2_12_FULL_44_11 TaxID=1801796 RepID=A0A1F6Y817_9BACT|nr:MAG: hypothetical protein A3G53_01170 [Candidatus Nomurabacteria bacterium RIFCSPLOWO2_12_FULL_44_11]
MKNFFKKLRLKRRVVTALAALHFYGNPSTKLKVIGVTGTNGKTTTTTLLYKVATTLGYKAGLIGTVENIIAGEVRDATHTTPDPIYLNKLLSEMAYRGCEYVFMEISSHALDQRRVAGITFAGGVFTNLTHDHLDYHKSLENYFLAKKKFFKMLPTDAFALANADDEHGRLMLEGTRARQFFYGFKDAPDFKGEISSINFYGLELLFNQIYIKSHLLGKFNAYNLLAVWSVCQLLGFNMERVGKILETIEPPRGRFEHFTAPNGVLVVVDYAHSPDALEKIFEAVLEIKQRTGKLISVFGCGGDRDPLKRRVMGKIGAVNSDIAIFTSDNPRSENPEQIIFEMKTDLSMKDTAKVKVISDRHEAIKEAVRIAKGGDIILCAGKGHEDYQEIKGVKRHFSDMEEFKKAYGKL